MMSVGGGGVRPTCGGDGDGEETDRQSDRQTEVVFVSLRLILRSAGSLTCCSHGSRQYCEKEKKWEKKPQQTCEGCSSKSSFHGDKSNSTD